jgi:hypothetical protein
MQTLLKQQNDFAHAVAKLIEKAFQLGYHVTLGEAYRDPNATWGSKKSFHKKRLAIDVNLFDKDWIYLTDTEHHKKLGEWWESVGGTWGGRFNDGNHYSWGE